MCPIFLASQYTLCSISTKYLTMNVLPINYNANEMCSISELECEDYKKVPQQKPTVKQNYFDLYNVSQVLLCVKNIRNQTLKVWFSCQWSSVHSETGRLWVPSLGHTKDCKNVSNCLPAWHPVLRVGSGGLDHPIIPRYSTTAAHRSLMGQIRRLI